MNAGILPVNADNCFWLSLYFTENGMERGNGKAVEHSDVHLI